MYFLQSAGSEGILAMDAISQPVTQAVAGLLPLAVLAPLHIVQALVADALAHPAQVQGSHLDMPDCAASGSGPCLALHAALAGVLPDRAAIASWERGHICPVMCYMASQGSSESLTPVAKSFAVARGMMPSVVLSAGIALHNGLSHLRMYGRLGATRMHQRAMHNQAPNLNHSSMFRPRSQPNTILSTWLMKASQQQHLVCPHPHHLSPP